MIPEIQVNITRKHPEPPPNRKLRIECQVMPLDSGDIFIHDVWVDVQLQTGQKIAEGRLFQGMYARAGRAVVRRHDPGLGVFHIPLSPSAIACIESTRAGGDVDLAILATVQASYSNPDNPMLLLAPAETSFVTLGSDRVVCTIPQSDWIKILRALQWAEYELAELPGSSRASAVLKRAFAKFDEATEFYRKGDWEETLASCRKAFEALVQDVQGTTDMSRATQAFSSLIKDDRKAGPVDCIVKELGRFLQLGRHEQPDPLTVGRADAASSLHITFAVLKYASEA